MWDRQGPLTMDSPRSEDTARQYSSTSSAWAALSKTRHNLCMSKLQVLTLHHEEETFPAWPQLSAKMPGNLR